MTKPNLTVFLGVYNRLSTLERTVRSYKRLRTPHELIIVDNGTDHPECLALLAEIQRKKLAAKVYHLPGCMDMSEAQENFNHAIRMEFEHGSGAKWFAVSEADVCFDGSHPASLDAYISVAEHTGVAVGPHLRVDAGIPANYPLRSRVLACESRLLYRQDMEWLIDERKNEIPYSKCQIDTTFHLFPRTRFFDRLHLDPIRVGPPFDAMHLDWYLDPFKPTRESEIYIPDERPVGSWGKAWLRDWWLWQRELGPERAFEMLLQEPLNPDDLCNVSFLVSWCYQYGHGVEVNESESLAWLRAAIPYPHEHYWPYFDRWVEMVYRNDFSSLGWET